jgi:hypothetical protein
MSPDTLGTLLAFLALIVPGLAFELLRERRRPFIEETAFREASRIALTSVIFTGSSVLVVTAISALKPSWFSDPAQWLKDGQLYLQAHLGLAVRTVAVVVLLSLALAVLTDLLLRRSAPGRIVAGSVWFAVFRQHRPAGSTPWVHLRLSDETEIWGYVGDYTPDAKLDNRELVIEGPKLQYRKKGADKNTMLPTWSFLCVRGESIVWMKVQYVTNGSSEIVKARYSRSATARLRQALKSLRDRISPASTRQIERSSTPDQIRQ